MYAVSQAFMNALKNDTHRYRITGTIGDLPFTGDNILENSLSINNQCTNADDVTLGSVFIGEFTATFVGIYEDRGAWKNKKITVNFSLYTSQGWETVPLGVFRVSDAEKNDFGVTVTAYDNMAKFDKKFKLNTLSGTVYDLLMLACDKCKVTLGMKKDEVNRLPNGSKSLTMYGSENKENKNDIETYRDLLSWIAQTIGGFATINRRGELILRTYEQEIVDTIDDEHRLTGGKWSDYVTHYTGIYVGNMDGTLSYYGFDPDDVADEIDRLEEEIADLYVEMATIDEQLTDIDLDITDKQDEKKELKRRYAAGQLTDEEYLLQLSEIEIEIETLKVERSVKKKQRSSVKGDINQKEARIVWLDEQAQDDGVAIELGDNPFIQYKDGEKMRKTILSALDNIAYVPFVCSSVLNVIYDLGDVVLFSGGIADDALCCVMAYNFTDSGEYEMRGYGTDPAIAAVRSKNQKDIRANRADSSRNQETKYYIFTNPVAISTSGDVTVFDVTFMMTSRSALIIDVEIILSASSETGQDANYVYIGDCKASFEYELDTYDLDRYPVESYGGGDRTLHLNYAMDTIDPGVHNLKLLLSVTGGTITIKRGNVLGVISGVGLDAESWNGLIDASDTIDVRHLAHYQFTDEMESHPVPVDSSSISDRFTVNLGRMFNFTDNFERSE